MHKTISLIFVSLALNEPGMHDQGQALLSLHCWTSANTQTTAHLPSAPASVQHMPLCHGPELRRASVQLETWLSGGRVWVPITQLCKA